MAIAEEVAGRARPAGLDAEVAPVKEADQPMAVTLTRPAGGNENLSRAPRARPAAARSFAAVVATTRSRRRRP